MRRTDAVGITVVAAILLVIGGVALVIVNDMRVIDEAYERCLIENGYDDATGASGRASARDACDGSPPSPPTDE